MNKAPSVVVQASTFAANHCGGLDVCKNDCQSKDTSHTAIYSEKGQKNKKKYQGARCCSSCTESYLSPEDRAIVKKEFDIVPTDTGFWEVDKGCRLPRSHRPQMCLLYYCNTMQKKAPAAVAILRFAQTVR